MHQIVEKGSVVRSVTFHAARKKLKLPRWSGMIQSNTKPLLVKVYIAPLKQKKNLSGKTVKWVYFEFAKSCAIRAKSVPSSYFYVPTWQRRANFWTWRANVPKSVPFFQLRLPNGVPIFQLFFKIIMFFYVPNKFIPNIFYIFCIF